MHAWHVQSRVFTPWPQMPRWCSQTKAKHTQFTLGSLGPIGFKHPHLPQPSALHNRTCLCPLTSDRTRNARAPTTPRGIGFCAIWDCISSSSSSSPHPASSRTGLRASAWRSSHTRTHLPGLLRLEELTDWRGSAWRVENKRKKRKTSRMPEITRKQLPIDFSHLTERATHAHPLHPAALASVPYELY